MGVPSPARMLPGGAMPGMPGGQDERVAILVAEFPMFAPAMLADILYANGADLDRTMEILTQLQVRIGGGVSEGPSLRGIWPSLLAALSLLSALLVPGENPHKPFTPCLRSGHSSLLTDVSGS